MISFFAGKKISKGVVSGVISFIEEIEEDKEHPIRKNIQDSLLKIAKKAKTDPYWEERINSMRDEFVTTDRIEEYASDLWQSLKMNLTESFDKDDSTLQKYIKKNIEKLSHNLNENEDMILKINGWIRHFLYRMILRNVTEVETLISKTVGDWEGKELSDKLELEVGKDLQFIRINGTIVGGIVGLIIYTVTQLFFH